MSMKKLIFVFLAILFSLPSHAQTTLAGVQEFCEVGGVRVSTSGLPSTTMVQASYPSCVVTVYLTGTTTKATIYKDGNSTTLTNPFTASSNGSYLFYATAGVGLDIVMSGGTPIPFPNPAILTDVIAGGGVSPITKIVAGTNITISPDTGLGEVTINSTGGGGGSPVVAGSAQYANAGATAFFSGGLYNTDVFKTANNGVALFQTSGACTGIGCYGNIPATSNSVEDVSSALSVNGTHISDYRFGSLIDYYYNINGANVSGPYAYSESNCFDSLQPTTNPILQSNCHVINDFYSAPGYYQNGSPTNNFGLLINQNASGRGITQSQSNVQNCFKAGDCGLAYWYQHARGIELAGNDEGVVGWSFEGNEYGSPWGTVTTGGAGATIITPNFVGWTGQAGDGFILLDQSNIFSQGNMLTATSGGAGLPWTITTTDTHAASTAVAFLTAPCGPSSPVVRNAPVSSTCSFTTTGGGFGTFSAAAKNVVCFGDYTTYYEQSSITSVGSGTITLPLTVQHPAGVEIGQGGPCSSYLVEGLGTANPIGVSETTDSGTNLFKPTSFPIVAAKTTTSLDFVRQFKQGQNGSLGLIIPFAYQSVAGVPVYSSSIVTASSSGTVLTLNLPGPATLLNGWPIPSASQACVTGNSNSALNVCTTVTPTTTNNAQTVNFAVSGTAGSGTGGTLTITNLNNYQAVMGAETVAVLGVTEARPFPAQLQLDPNSATWGVGDPIVQVNAYNSDYSGGRVTYTADTPPSSQTPELFAWNMSGAYFGGAVIFDVNASENCNLYFGCGGTFPGHSFLNFHDFYSTLINLSSAPLNGGCIICTGGIPAGSTGTTYNFLEDVEDGIFLTMTPNTGSGAGMAFTGNFSAANGAFTGGLQANNLTLDNGVAAHEIQGTNPAYLWGGNGGLTPGDIVFVNNTFSAQDAGIALNRVPSYVGNIGTSGSSPASLTVTGLTSSSVCLAQGVNSAALTQTVFTSTATNAVSINYTTPGAAEFAVFCTFPTPASVTD